MRRYVQIIGLLVLALGAGGWGAVVAATLCPHANPGAAVMVPAEMPMQEDHACCPEKNRAPEQEKAHCHDSGTEPEATGAMEQKPDEFIDSSRLDQTEASCAHCMGRSEIPATGTFAHKPPQTKRAVEAVAQTASTAPSTSSFTSPVLYRQGAPPGSSAPKHLLIGVLLI